MRNKPASDYMQATCQATVVGSGYNDIPAVRRPMFNTRSLIDCLTGMLGQRAERSRCYNGPRVHDLITQYRRGELNKCISPSDIRRV